MELAVICYYPSLELALSLEAVKLVDIMADMKLYNGRFVTAAAKPDRKNVKAIKPETRDS